MSSYVRTTGDISSGGRRSSECVDPTPGSPPVTRVLNCCTRPAPGGVRHLLSTSLSLLSSSSPDGCLIDHPTTDITLRRTYRPPGMTTASRPRTGPASVQGDRGVMIPGRWASSMHTIVSGREQMSRSRRDARCPDGSCVECRWGRRICASWSTTFCPSRREVGFLTRGDQLCPVFCTLESGPTHTPGEGQRCMLGVDLNPSHFRSIGYWM